MCYSLSERLSPGECRVRGGGKKGSREEEKKESKVSEMGKRRDVQKQRTQIGSGKGKEGKREGKERKRVDEGGDRLGQVQMRIIHYYTRFRRFFFNAPR